METKVEIVYKPDRSTKRRQPIFIATVPAGFPSPAADYEEGKLDLNRHLIKNPAATFFVRVTGDSMLKAGIHNGDLLVVDRSIKAQENAKFHHLRRSRHHGIRIARLSRRKDRGA